MSGGRLQEVRKFISTASLKQLRTKCMLSLSQCCFGNRSDHWHAVIPHINPLAQNKGWEMCGETGRGREQEIVRERHREREKTNVSSSKLCKRELLLQTFPTLSIAQSVQGIPLLYVVNTCHLPCIYSSNYTHTPLNDVSTRSRFPWGGVVSIPVLGLQKRKLLVVLVGGSPRKWERKECQTAILWVKSPFSSLMFTEILRMLTTSKKASFLSLPLPCL